MKNYPAIPTEAYGTYEFTRYRQPYDLTELQESILEYLDVSDNEDMQEIHDEVIMMSDGLLEEDRCMDAYTLVHGGAYYRTDDGQLVPLDNLVAGQYKGIASVYDPDVRDFLLFHEVSPAILHGPESNIGQPDGRSIFVPLLSPTIKIYPQPTFTDPEIAQYIESSAQSGKYQPRILQMMYERIKSAHPEEMDLFLTKLKQHFDAKGGQVAFLAREAFEEAIFVCSTGKGYSLSYRGQILAFFEMDDYEYRQSAGNIATPVVQEGQKILGAAVMQRTVEGNAEKLVRIPLLTCDSIYALETV